MRDAGELAKALHILRIVRGWNQKELAAASGVRGSSLSDYERGKVVPELRSVTAMLEAMGYRFADLDDTLAFVRRAQEPRAPEAALP